MLSYIEGDAPQGLTPSFYGDIGVVESVARLIREFHDCVRTFDVPANAIWRWRSGVPSEGEIICHNDLVPWNVIFQRTKPVAFIDWDMAGPDRPIADIAYAVVHFVPLHDDERCISLGWRHPPQRGPRLRAFCDAYGLSSAERGVLLDEVKVRMERVHRGLRAGMESGDPSFKKLWDQGVGNLPLRDIAFIERNNRLLSDYLAESPGFIP